MHQSLVYFLKSLWSNGNEHLPMFIVGVRGATQLLKHFYWEYGLHSRPIIYCGHRNGTSGHDGPMRIQYFQMLLVVVTLCSKIVRNLFGTWKRFQFHLINHQLFTIEKLPQNGTFSSCMVTFLSQVHTCSKGNLEILLISRSTI